MFGESEMCFNMQKNEQVIVEFYDKSFDETFFEIKQRRVLQNND